jgi:hypothetical protein
MKFADIIMIAIIAACVVGAIIVIRKKKGCCSDCSACDRADQCKIKDGK